MKKYTLFLFTILYISMSAAFGQNKIDKFCEVRVITGNSLTAKMVARISFGENRWLFNPKDSSVFKQLKYVNTLTTGSDVLNYMAKLGWQLINAHAEAFIEILYFKKTFDTTEFTADANAPSLNN